MIDPYKILGVTKKSSIEEIKKSYRKLAKKYHPDVNPNNKEAEKKFKDISNAYDLIGTTEAKVKFDSEQENRSDYAGQNGDRFSQSFYANQTGFGPGGIFDDLFNDKFSRRSNRSSFSMKGQDVIYEMNIEFLDAVLGTQTTLTFQDGKKLQVKIPAGIEEGKKLKIQGHGEPGIGGGKAGDAYVKISIKPHKIFSRVGNDIVSEVPVSFFEAMLGAEINVPTIEGSVNLKVPSGVTTGSKLRIKNKGVIYNGTRGNQIVILKVAMPKNPDASFISAVEKLGKNYSYNPRV